MNNVSGPNVVFSGVNVHVVSGSGATDDHGTPTGLGNLIVGYDEMPSPTGLPPGYRLGCNNLVVGELNDFAGYGGLVAGESNTTSGAMNVVFGDFNQASGDEVTVTGGFENISEGLYTSVSGGSSNDAIGSTSSISGGHGLFEYDTDGWATSGYKNP